MINGKIYIGQSINIKKRWSGHRRDYLIQQTRAYNTPLYQAFRKYGLENFLFEVLEECLPNQLDDKEVFYIAHFNSFGPAGYNQTAGGAYAEHIYIQPDMLSKVFQLLKTTEKTYNEIAEEVDLEPKVIHLINNGKCYYNPNEEYPIRAPLGELAKYNNFCVDCGARIEIRHTRCVKCSNVFNNFKLRRAERPNPIDLAKMIVESSFVKVGEQFGVSDNAIKKWCKNYGIPTKRYELFEWYNSQVEEKQQIKSVFPGSKSVRQIDPKTGNVIAIFSSVCSAAKSMGSNNNSHIVAVCRGREKTAYGYIWEYDGDNEHIA